MSIRIIVIIVHTALAFKVRSQNYSGYELSEDYLIVNCPFVNDWSRFNEIDFGDVRHLWIYDLSQHDTINFPKFKSIQELGLVDVRISDTLQIARLFPDLKSLTVDNYRHSNLSYKNIQSLDSLSELSIRDREFKNTCDLSEFKQLTSLEIFDNSTVTFIKSNLTILLPDSLDYLGVLCHSSCRANSFLQVYFNQLVCRKLSIDGRGIELRKHYDFQLCYASKLPKLKEIKERTSRRIVIAQPWISIERDMSKYIRLSKYYSVDVAAGIGFRGCPNDQYDWKAITNLNFFLLNERFSTDCTSFPYVRIDKKSWAEFTN